MRPAGEGVTRRERDPWEAVPLHCARLATHQQLFIARSETADGVASSLRMGGRGRGGCNHSGSLVA